MKVANGMFHEVISLSEVQLNAFSKAYCRLHPLNVNVCKCIRNWPLPIGAFQEQCKQIMINKHS